MQRRLARRYLAKRGIARCTRAFVETHGLEVRGGPFPGLSYTPEVIPTSGDLVAKLLGAYERELHGLLGGWIQQGFSTIVNVGCGEGYYAVGLARMLPQARIYAFDTDPYVRRLCEQMAELNGVGERVFVASECGPGELNELAARDAAVIVDCEGCELDLLRPDAAPALREATVLVELHDNVDPAISSTVPARFERTHGVDMIEVEPRHVDAYDELRMFDRATAALLLSELRPPDIRWGCFTPTGHLDAEGEPSSSGSSAAR